MKTLLVFFLFISCAVRAQIPGIDSSVRVHSVLMSRIDSSKTISGAAKDTVLIMNGTAVSLARVMAKPVPIVMRYALGGIEAPFEVFEYDTAWAGSGTNPDTMRLVARNLMNSTVWPVHVWDTGTWIEYNPTLTLKIAVDSIRKLEGTVYTGGSTGNFLKWGTPPTWATPTGIVPGGSAGGDLGGSYPNPTVLSVADVTTGTLAVANGGTGLATLTAHDVLVGNGTGSATLISPTTNTGYVLTSNGTGSDPTFQAVTGGSSYWFPGAGAYPLPTIYTDSNVVIAGNDSIVGSESVGTSLRVGNANVTAVANTVALGEGNNVNTGSGDFAIGLGNTVGGGGGSGALGFGNTLYGSSCLLTGAYTTDNGYGDYTFIWGDGSAPTRNYGAYQFIARASGGFVFLDDTTNTPEIPVLAMRNDSVLFDNNPIADQTGRIIVNSLIPGTSGYVLTSTSGGVSWQPASGGGGSVTSVALALPSSILTVSGSPVTTSGTLTGTLATQTANTVWAGPTSGSAAAPTFRSIVSADVPTLNQNTTGTANIAGGTAGAIPYQSAANTTTVLAATATANKILLSGASAAPVWSTPTFPNASATSRKIIVSDGTNWVASTETYAVPGTSGNVLTSDGTNWTSAAATGGGLPAGGNAKYFLGYINGAAQWTQLLSQKLTANTLTDGLELQDTLVASSGNQATSPALHLQGRGWEATNSSSNLVDWWEDVLPIQGATQPNSKLRFSAEVNSRAVLTPMTLDTGANLSLATGGSYQINGTNMLNIGNVNTTIFLDAAGNGVLTTGANNFGSGSGALAVSTSGTDNIAMGFNALHADISGSGNVAIGRQALLGATGGNNVAIGYQAGSGGTPTSSIAIGYQTAQNFSSGSAAYVGVGYDALDGLTTGVGVIGIGASSATANQTGSYSCDIGYGSGARSPTNASNVLRLGGSLAAGEGYTTIYFPNSDIMVAGSNPDDGTIQITGSHTGGTSDTARTGGAFILSSGLPTGGATSPHSYIAFKNAPTGGTKSNAAQSAVEDMRVDTQGVSLAAGKTVRFNGSSSGTVTVTPLATAGTLTDTLGTSPGMIVTASGAANGTVGTATLSAGTVTVSTTSVLSTSIIMLTVQGSAVVAGTVESVGVGTVTNGASFVINSSLITSTSKVFWMLVNP